MKRFASVFAQALALVVVLGLVSVAHAAKGNKPLKGKIVSVGADGLSIVISAGGKDAAAAPVTVTCDAGTKVIIDGAESKDGVKALQPGQHVTVTPSTGTALTIEVAAKGAGKAGKKGAAAAPTAPKDAK